jgi:two-component system, OmpR family, phosphate regulon response regulator PhoB
LALVVLNWEKVSATTKKILIVETEGDWQELLTQVIGRSGYQVIEVNSGTQAIDQATAVHPDLILLDFGLPGMSADQVIGELKMNSSTKDIPVIVQATYDDHTRVRHAMEAGAKQVL